MNKTLEYFCHRFGIRKDVFSGISVFDGSKGKKYLCSCTKTRVSGEEFRGMVFARTGSAVPKPTTAFILMFGKFAKKNVVCLSKKQAKDFVLGKDVPLSGNGCSEGYVVVMCGENPLGCGHLKKGVLRSMVPREKRIPLKYL